MELIPRQQLLALAEPTAEARVSLLMPTHRAGQGVVRDQIRWRNLIRAATKALGDSGLSKGDTAQLLQDAHRIEERRPQAAPRSDGLAFFAGPGWSRVFRVPLRLPMLAAIGNRCQVGPLLPMLTMDSRFFVLGLSADEIRLYEATRLAIDEVALEGLPLGPLATMPRERAGAHVFATAGGGSSGGPAVFHGTGYVADAGHKDAILRHFHRVDQAVRQILAGDHVPLVLAGVGYLHALYREANTYSYLLSDGVIGGLRDLSPAHLHQRGWEIAGPVLRNAETLAAARFTELHGTGLTATDPAAVAGAAQVGRVETLFVSTEASIWRPPPGRSILLLDEPTSGAALLERAAVDTLRQAGDVYAVPAERVPGTGSVAAVLRY